MHMALKLAHKNVLLWIFCKVYHVYSSYHRELHAIRVASYVTLFTVFALSAGFQHTKISIGNTGNQNHPDLKVRVVLVTCISNIDYLEAGNQPIMQKMVNKHAS